MTQIPIAPKMLVRVKQIFVKRLTSEKLKELSRLCSYDNESGRVRFLTKARQQVSAKSVSSVDIGFIWEIDL